MLDNGFYDIHSHVLYDIDDGARSIEESIELCALANDTGTDYLFLTPHLMHWESADELYDVREDYAEYLQNILYNEGINLKLYKGFEIYCNDDIFNVKYFKPYTMNGSRYILLEFDFFSPTETDVTAWCSYILDNGLVPIIAHPERYDFVKADITSLERLSNLGCLFQVNCGSAVGMFGEVTELVALKMFSAGYVDFIGSDAHDRRWRNTNMGVVIDNLSETFDEKILIKALIDNPEKMVNDEPIVVERSKI